MKRHILYSLVVGVTAVFGAITLGKGDVSAADQTLTTADTTAQIQAAIDQAIAGDTITFSAGTYDLTDFLDIHQKTSVTLTGMGTVILKYDGQTATTTGIGQAIRILDSNSITLTNLTVQAANPATEAVFSTASSGIGINSSCEITLRNITVSGFGGQAGVLVTRLNDDTGSYSCPAGNITFDTTSLLGNNYGIFFTDRATTPPNADIIGIVFEGVNTFRSSSFDQNFAIASHSEIGEPTGVAAFGPGGETLNVGVIDASGYEDHNWYAVKRQVVSIMPGSLLDGTPVEEFDPIDLASIFCFVLFEEEELCPDGSVPDENGDCGCPEGQVPDKDGECCPVGFTLNDAGECIPRMTVPDTGSEGPMQDLANSNAIWLVGIGGGALIGTVIIVDRTKRYNRIKL